MRIEKKWAVREPISDTYFAGMDAQNKPVFIDLCSGIKLYKSARSAGCAINIIMQCGFDGQPEAEYFEDITVQDVPPESAAPVEPEHPVMESAEGWRLLDQFGRIKYWTRDKDGGKEYAYTDRNGAVRWLGTDELAAWYTYSTERMEVGADIIMNRGKVKH